MKKDHFLSRIDRSVADNLKDIEKSYGQDAGIVKDFIVFITKKLKLNLFGFTRFTLNDFCKETGRTKQDLCQVHPFFVNNPKEKPPEYHGHKFMTVFDFALFNMLQKNIIFSKAYAWNTKSQTIQLTNFTILKDIKLNVDRSSNAIKIYDVRLSEDVMQGFLQRYYTIETNGYRLVGKGRGGDGRKSLYIFLYKTRHLLISQQQFKASFSVDYLCQIASIVGAEPKHRKLSLKRVLNAIIEKGLIPFSFEFVQGDSSIPYQELYYVAIDFFKEAKSEGLVEKHSDNYFFINLFDGLKQLYQTRHGKKKMEDEKDMFQHWLNNSSFDYKEKAAILIKAYFNAYHINIMENEAREMIANGLFSNEEDDSSLH